MSFWGSEEEGAGEVKGSPAWVFKEIAQIISDQRRQDKKVSEVNTGFSIYFISLRMKRSNATVQWQPLSSTSDSLQFPLPWLVQQTALHSACIRNHKWMKVGELLQTKRKGELQGKLIGCCKPHRINQLEACSSLKKNKKTKKTFACNYHSIKFIILYYFS